MYITCVHVYKHPYTYIHIYIYIYIFMFYTYNGISCTISFLFNTVFYLVEYIEGFCAIDCPYVI